MRLWEIFSKVSIGKIEIKGPEFIHDAMAHYQRAQFPSDAPMRELFDGNLELREKLLHR